MFLFEEGQPVDLGYSMVVSIVPVVDVRSTISFNLGINEVILVGFLDPLHLSNDAH